MSNTKQMSLLSRKLAAAGSFPLTTLQKPSSNISFNNTYITPKVEECEQPYITEETFQSSPDALCSNKIAYQSGNGRDTKLYQKLNMLMADKSGNEPLLARSPTKLALEKLFEKKNQKRAKISKAKFTLQEDQLISQYYATFGCNWKKIATYLPGRTENMIKNRYYATMSKKQSSEALADMSANSSENRMTQSSGESTFFDELSEQMTGKYSESEPNSGLIKMKPVNIKKDDEISIDFFAEPAQMKEEAQLEPIMECPGFDFMDKSRPRRSSYLIPTFGQVDENKEHEFWEPIDFGNDLPKVRRISAEFLGFDQAPYGQEGTHSLNLFPQDNFCESLLNFKEDNTFSKEHPLAPIEKASDVAMDLEFNSIFSQEAKPQEQTPQAPQDKLNQLQYLMSQIRNIEQLFDRTKQQISMLQNQYTAK